MKRPWTISVLAPLILVLLGATSCEFISRTLRGTSDNTIEPIGNQSGENQSNLPVGTQALNADGNLVNEDVGVQLTLPESWARTDDLSNIAQLQAADQERDLYMVVVGESDAALMRLGLQENAANYRALLAENLAEYEGQSPTDVAFVGDNFASQYEIRGQLADGTPVVYLHTTVLVDDQYYQIVGWTTPEQYDTYRSELQNITETFQENGS